MKTKNNNPKNENELHDDGDIQNDLNDLNEDTPFQPFECVDEDNDNLLDNFDNIEDEEDDYPDSIDDFSEEQLDEVIKLNTDAKFISDKIIGGNVSQFFSEGDEIPSWSGQQSDNTSSSLAINVQQQDQSKLPSWNDFRSIVFSELTGITSKSSICNTIENILAQSETVLQRKSDRDLILIYKEFANAKSQSLSNVVKIMELAVKAKIVDQIFNAQQIFGDDILIPEQDTSISVNSNVAISEKSRTISNLIRNELDKRMGIVKR